MPEVTEAAQILRMFDECDPAARDKFIEVVRKLEGWSMTPNEVWRRLRQAARPVRGVTSTGRRHFDVRWAIAALQVSTYFGGPDYVSDLFAEAKLEGKRARRERSPERTLIHRVRRAGDARRERA